MPLIVLSEKIGPLEVLTYLVACPESREALIVDPGGPAPTLAAQLDQKSWQVRWIVNTHGHADHLAGNDFWAARTGAPIVMHHLDWEFYRRPEMQAQAQAEGFPPLTRVDLPVADGHLLPLGVWQAQVLHTPGHTPGPSASLFPAISSPGTPCSWRPPAAPICREARLTNSSSLFRKKSCPCRMTPASGPDMTTAARPLPPWGKKNSITPTLPISSKLSLPTFNMKREHRLPACARPAEGVFS